MIKDKNIFFIFSHIDDETILSYGTLKKLALNNNINIITMCGISRNKDTHNQRLNSYKYILNNDLKLNFIIYDYSDLTLTEKIVNKHLTDCFNMYSPNIVFTHSQKDLHFEHRLVSEQVLLKCRHINSTVKTLYTTVSPTHNWTYGQYGNFQPNMFIDISEYANDKIDALKLYDMELPQNQMDNRSIDSIMTWNKMYGHTIGVKYVEPYEQIFSII